MSDAFELEICQGKYRYRYEAGKQEVWRNGEPWEVMNGRLIGDKFVFSLAVELDEALKERDALRAKVERMERQGPVACVWRCDNGHIHGSCEQTLPMGAKLYALPGAQNVPKAVAYLDIGAGGYMDIGTDLTDKELATLPKGRHMLGIVGTYGVDGYVPAQPAPIEMSITTGALSEMFLSLDGYDKAQPGYEWRKGWNDAIRQAMDYAQPAPSVPDRKD